MMHLFIVSASAWTLPRRRQACQNIALRLLASKGAQAQTIVIDLTTVMREPENPLLIHDVELPPAAASMRSWIDHYFRDQPMLDVERVHRAAQAICVRDSNVAAIDATALNADLIDRTMNQLRIAFYGCEHWPKVLMLIVDDTILHDVAGFAGRVFYIQPEVTGQSQINTLLAHIKRFAKLEGIFGLRHQFITKLIKFLTRQRRFGAVTEEK